MYKEEVFKLLGDSKGDTYIYSIRSSKPIAKVLNEYECKELMSKIQNSNIEDLEEDLEDELEELENKNNELKNENDEYKDILKSIKNIIKNHPNDHECAINKIYKECLNGVWY